MKVNLQNLSGTPLKAMVWHLNKAVQGPYITAENMSGCTELAINEALDALKAESEEMYQQVLDQLGLER